VNLSCNFFRGSFDVPAYISFVDSYWREIEVVEKTIAGGRHAPSGNGAATQGNRPQKSADEKTLKEQ
jgi:hypothetical protein